MNSVVLQRLREGVETSPPLDPRSRWLYLIMAAEFVIGLPIFILMGFSLHLDPKPAIGGAALIVSCWLLRRVGHARLAGGVEVVLLTIFYALPTLFLIFPLLAISGPLADPWLASVDRALGFDWFAFIGLFRGRPVLTGLMVWAYTSFFWQTLIVLPLLWLIRAEDRAWAFVTAAVVATAITLALYPFAPADDAFVHYGVTRGAFPLSVDVPWTTSPVVRSIKDGARSISYASLKGIITFPSFHTAAAIMLIWAGWPVRIIRYPVMVLNALMIVSCIVVGAHYLIDLIVGAGIGCVAVAVASRMVAATSAPSRTAQLLRRSDVGSV
jgi:membrane-associated phospholipid phosphatase